MDSPGWIYTIGHNEHQTHPELVVVGLPYEFGYRLLDFLSGRVLDGHPVLPGQNVQCGDVHFHVGAVDPDRWEDDTFNCWKDYYYSWRDVPPPEPSAVELTACGNQPNPFLEASLAGPTRPNRAQRRSAARRDRRHLRMV